VPLEERDDELTACLEDLPDVFCACFHARSVSPVPRKPMRRWLPSEK
jgi:hypothetical protein